MTAPLTPARTVRPGLALTALAIGGFAIGTTEFMTMGLLPQVADGIDVSVARAGHVITAYALGVVVGAPLLVALGSRLPRRGLAIALVLALGIGNAASALADSYPAMLAARFVAGLPHGAYFGVASLVAASLVPPERRGRAISMVMLGLSVATVAGVPASTWLGQQWGWRSAYLLVVGIAGLAALAIAITVPPRPGDASTSMRRELQALRRPGVIVAAGAGMVGFGGLFAMYTFIAPLVTTETGLPESAVPWFLLIFGIGSVAGTVIAGRLADWNVDASVRWGFVATAVVLVALAAAAGVPVLLGLAVGLIGVLGSVLAITLQVRLMHAAGEAEMIGAAVNHSALNVANGLGAWVGSAVLSAGFGYRVPSLVGAGLALVGLVVFAAGGRWLVRGRQEE